MHGQDGGGNERSERADHVNLSVGEIDELQDAVNHRVAQGNERINAPACQSSQK